MKVKDLRGIFDGLEALFRAGGSAASAADVMAVKGLFDGRDEQDAREFYRDTATLLDAEVQEQSKVLVADYVDRLRAAQTDEQKFNHVFEELKKDKRLGKDSADAIAHEYVNGRHSWPKKADALRAIRKKFNERVYQESKMEIVERFKVW